MEVDLFLLVKFEDSLKASMVVDYLDEESRPDDSTQLPQESRDLFEIIDDLPYPEFTSQSGSEVEVSFFLGGSNFEGEIKHIKKVVSQLDAESVATILWDGESFAAFEIQAGGSKSRVTKYDENLFTKAEEDEEFVFELLRSARL